MRRYRGLVVGVMLTIAMAVSGCSSSGGGTSTGPSGASSGASEIRIGVVGSYSGPIASSLAGSKLSIQAWADSVNAAGGINGHQVRLYIKDDGGALAASLTDVKSLVEQDHVVAIVGQATGSVAPWATYVADKGIPVIGGNPVDVTYLSNPDFYSVGGNLISDFYGVAALAASNGPKLGNLFCAELPACAATTTLLSSFGTSLGVSVSYSSKVSASAPDFTAFCQGMKQAGVQSYTLGLAASTLLQVASQCGQQGLKADLVGSFVADSTYASNPIFDGMKLADPVFPFFDDSTPATQAFQAAIRKYTPSLGTAKQPLNPEAAQAWASGKLFEAAVKAAGAGAITPASLKTGLYALRGETLGGLSVPLTFTAGKPSLHNCSFAYEISGGTFTEPKGLAPTCAPDPTIAAVAAKI
jgi:branched-chain amino acid transport system substrate-binding protein